VKIDKDAGWVTGPAARCALCYLFTGAADVIMIGIFGQQRRRETQLTARVEVLNRMIRVAKPVSVRIT
jgi:hypothetical protein